MNYPVLRACRILWIVITILASFSGFEVSARAQIAMQVFVDPSSVVSGGTIGFAFAGNKFVGSVDHDGIDALYATDLDGTNVRVFAPGVSVPGGSVSNEHCVASSLGLGGFPSRDIYVGAGNGVLHITNDGAKSDMFVTALAAPVRGILFDIVGSFGNDMLVATNGGQVYEINSSGSAKLIASLGEDSEGMGIAPLGGNFGSFDGQLIVASENSGLLRAISSSGKVSILNQGNPIPSAEAASFVPLDLGASGSNVEGLYEANWTVHNVVKADRKEFMEYRGDLIVTSELGDRRISRVHWNGSSFDITVIGQFPNYAEDGVFVSPSMINPGAGCPAGTHDGPGTGRDGGGGRGPGRPGEPRRGESGMLHD